MRRLAILFLSVNSLSIYGSEESFVLYCEKEQIEQVGIVDRDLYREAVMQLPICCVDIFLFDPIQQSYLLVLRGMPPKKGDWWFPGGRLYKGESFYECAMRKCKDEVGVEVIPIAQLGTATTIFPDSAWGCQTHTVNTVVLAKVKNGEVNPKTDCNHEEYLWKSIDAPPDDPYLLNAYREAMKVLSTSFSND